MPTTLIKRLFPEEHRYQQCLKKDFTSLFHENFDRVSLVDDHIISLTTTPTRIHHLTPTLNSLLLQSRRARSIEINIPTLYRGQTPYRIPEYIKSCWWININHIPKDLGPASKFLPSINKFKGQDMRIIVCDDDQIYPPDMIEGYAKNAQKEPDSVLSLAGWLVPKSLLHRDKKVSRFGAIKLFGKAKNTHISEVDIIQGASSYSIAPSFFDEEIFDYRDAPKEAFFVDDIWISGKLAQAGIIKSIIQLKSKYIRLANNRTHSLGLHKTDNSNDYNDNLLYQYFKEYWKYD